MITRRNLCALAALTLGRAPLLASERLAEGPSEPFSFDAIVKLARESAELKYAVPATPAPSVLDELDYGRLQEVRHPLRKALHAGTEFPVTLFHLGRLFRRPVRVFALEEGGAREVFYRKSLFDSPVESPAHDMPDNAGFAGFRVHDARLPEADRERADWAAFLGASYFRSSGDEAQYGVSARGIAINTEPSGEDPEEFPDFSRFYIAPESGGTTEVFCLLDGPSVTGAFHFKIAKRPSITFDVRCSLFFRKDVSCLGIAPATSMHFYSETYRYAGNDFRPEVHDSDGLAMWTGTGEQIWRPLNNPARAIVSSFSDSQPKGFGLLQRDRAFASYHDEVRYERRPHLWVEPIGSWGKGSIQLLELPTQDEYHDNIVAFWKPEEPIKAGDNREFAYRLSWGSKEPLPGNVARCSATRLAKGVFTVPQNRIDGRSILERQFVVEFDGPALVGRDAKTSTPILTLSRGHYDSLHAWPEADGSPQPWRVLFTVFAEGEEPVEMRLFLKDGEETLSETWAFQYFPNLWV